MVTRIVIDKIEHQMTMLARHLHVLQLVIAHEPIGIVKMSTETGYPRHKVRYSLRVLEAENLVEPTNQGATTTNQTSEYVGGFDENIIRLTDQLNGMKIKDTVESIH